MKTITAIEKGRQQDKLTVDGTVIHLEKSLVMRHRLKAGATLSKDSWQALMSENEKLYYDRLAILKLKRMQTTHQLVTYLLTKGAPPALVKTLIKHYQDKRYLDDDAYVKAYIDARSRREGPRMIKVKLTEKGIHEDLIIRHMRSYDETGILTTIAKKRIQSSKGKTKRQLILSTKSYLLGKGFTLEAVERTVQKALVYYQDDEQVLLVKVYQKLMARYGEKMDQDKLGPFIRQKLHAKGFRDEAIKRLLD